MIQRLLLEGIRKNIWADESSYEGCDVPTMLPLTELKMLAWLGENYEFDADDFVADLGSFLGGSTCAIASGIWSRNNLGDSARIRSYDMFKVPNDQYSRDLIGGDRRIGATVLDLYLENIKKYRELIRYYPGDLHLSRAPYKDLAICFVDLAKSTSLNEFVIKNFFNLLVPGRSLVIQQDHNDHSCPWVAISMEYLKDNFEYLADDGSSRIFLSTSPVRRSAADEIAALSLEAQSALLDAASARSKNPISGYLVLTSKAWIIHQQVGMAGALSFLEGIRDKQPWADGPYVDRVVEGLRYVSGFGGRSAELQGFFGE